MGTVRILRVGGPLAALNARNHQWHTTGMLVSVRHPSGFVATVDLPLEDVSAILEATFRAHGIPLPAHVGGRVTVGGMFGRLRRAASSVTKKAVPTRVRRAAQSAAKQLDRRAMQAAKIYASPQMLAALSAASVIPGVGVVTAPLAAGSMGTAAALRARRAVESVARGRPAQALHQAASAIPGASPYLNYYQQARSLGQQAQAVRAARGRW